VYAALPGTRPPLRLMEATHPLPREVHKLGLHAAASYAGRLERTLDAVDRELAARGYEEVATSGSALVIW
jgi:hypothetical protein